MTRAAESGARRIASMVTMLSTMTAFLIALTPGPAWAADCGLLGTSCVTDTLGQTAGGAVSTVQETVDQTVDEVVTVVEETVDETVDQVAGVVENVADTDGNRSLVEVSFQGGDDGVIAAEDVPYCKKARQKPEATANAFVSRCLGELIELPARSSFRHASVCSLT